MGTHYILINRSNQKWTGIFKRLIPQTQIKYFRATASAFKTFKKISVVYVYVSQPQPAVSNDWRERCLLLAAAVTKLTDFQCNANTGTLRLDFCVRYPDAPWPRRWRSSPTPDPQWSRWTQLTWSRRSRIWDPIAGRPRSLCSGLYQHESVSARVNTCLKRWRQLIEHFQTQINVEARWMFNLFYWSLGWKST